MDEPFWTQEANNNFKETQQVSIPNMFQRSEMGPRKAEKTLKLSKDQIIRKQQKRRNSLSNQSPKKQQQTGKQMLYSSTGEAVKSN